MMLLNTPPEPGEHGLTDYYRRCATEGSVFSGTIGNQSYGLSDSFDPAWSVAALCWCAGGTETYVFRGKETIHLKAGAVLAIGENERYAYTANSDRPFRSSMIVFPRAMTQSLSRSVTGLPDDDGTPDTCSPVIKTGILKPDDRLRSRLHAFSSALHPGSGEPENLEEQAALVASELVAVQNHDALRSDQLDSVKRTTREEQCRRLKRAVMLMHDAYDDCTLDLDTMAREACIAKHHFVRVFNNAYGITPLRYLGDLRMEAAARLLESMEASATEVANAVGFSNRSAFQRKFRQYFGTTPVAWRKANQL